MILRVKWKNKMKEIKITILSLSAILAFLAFFQSLYLLTDIEWVLLGMVDIYAAELIAVAMPSLALSMLANSIDRL